MHTSSAKEDSMSNKAYRGIGIGIGIISRRDSSGAVATPSEYEETTHAVVAIDGAVIVV